MNVDRDKIWQMFGCKCAYCGCDLQSSSGKHMHVDHVKPLVRNWWNGTSVHGENHTEENLFPACPQCNLYKSSLDIEMFRDWVADTIRKIGKFTLYRNALRFGMIEIKEWDKVFWFEKYKTEKP